MEAFFVFFCKQQLSLFGIPPYFDLPVKRPGKYFVHQFETKDDILVNLFRHTKVSNHLLFIVMDNHSLV